MSSDSADPHPTQPGEAASTEPDADENPSRFTPLRLVRNEASGKLRFENAEAQYPWRQVRDAPRAVRLPPRTWAETHDGGPVASPFANTSPTATPAASTAATPAATPPPSVVAQPTTPAATPPASPGPTLTFPTPATLPSRIPTLPVPPIRRADAGGFTPIDAPAPNPSAASSRTTPRTEGGAAPNTAPTQPAPSRAAASTASTATPPAPSAPVSTRPAAAGQPALPPSVAEPLAGTATAAAASVSPLPPQPVVSQPASGKTVEPRPRRRGPTGAMPAPSSSAGEAPSAGGQAPILVLDNVGKRYGSVEVFGGASLSVRPGEFIAILGESGIGKSTLLNCMAGLDHWDSGRIQLAGHDLGHLNETRRALLRRQVVGFVFQAFHVLPHLDVAQNVALPLMLMDDALRLPARPMAGDHRDAVDERDLSTPPGPRRIWQTLMQRLRHILGAGRADWRRDPRVASMLQAVGLDGLADRLPQQLSGGQLQRVAIARALVHRPALVLADEPTGNLDPDTSEQVMQVLRQLTRDQGTAVVLVTHSQSAASHADRVCTLKVDGIHRRPPVYRKPKNPQPGDDA